MFRSKGWFSGGIWKPKNPHSLEHLKYLYQLLSKNQNVTEQNKSLLVETLRLIAEILIWGDQNDSTVFDFFLEKNMLSFFLRIMKQKCGRYVCVQLLQTLNILFENIRNETSLYYLLSNNHVNSIIVHKFDFSDEEVMAYYISFLKTLSLKLNSHTIHFFYNEHTNDFPLYTEAIKFFNHSESMVRIAVRTLTLNVFRVEDRTMLKFIRDKTAAPYFSNLVWFIGNHVLELDSCVRSDAEASQQGQGRLSDLVAEHLDHLHYMNDILCLGIDSLNDVLSDHLLNRLLVPLYVYSLTKRRRHSQIEDDRPHVSSVVAFFLLSQVFLIISHQPLVQQLAHIILNKDMSIFYSRHRHDSASTKGETNSEPEFVPPEETLEKSLESTIRPRRLSGGEDDEEAMEGVQDDNQPSASLCPNDPDDLPATHVSCTHPSQEEAPDDALSCEVFKEQCTDESLSNITDEEKVEFAHRLTQSTLEKMQQDFSLAERPFLEAIFNALECTENDHTALFALCLLYALGHNAGINQDLLDTVLMPTDKSETKQLYNVNLVERLIKIIALSCQYNSKVRLATLQMSLLLMKQLVVKDSQSFLEDRHLAAVEQAREESTMLLRNFYKSEEIFLDMFEDEYQEMKKKPLNVEYLMMDANLLLPPMGTPMSGVGFDKRLPCGEVERARKTIRVFFLLRDLSLTLREEEEQQLPLTRDTTCINHEDILDLNNSDLLACTVVTKDGQKVRRFMVIDVLQLILVEPDTKRIGWGVTKFVGFLQDIEVTGDKDDSRCLHITVHRPAGSGSYSTTGTTGNNSRGPLLAARFVFDDNIRCMAAKQRLTKGRVKARQRKMHQIARLLDLPEFIQPCPSPLRHGLRNSASSTSAPSGNGSDTQPSSGMHRSHSQDTGLKGHISHSSYRPFFSGSGSGKVPGFATALSRTDGSLSNNNTLQVEKHSLHHHHHHHHHHSEHHRRVSSSPSGSGRRRSSATSARSRETSPRVRTLSSSEEIPLEDLSRGKSSSGAASRHGSPGLRRRSSMGLPQARISAPPYMSHPALSSPSNASHLSPGSNPDNDDDPDETDVFQDTLDIKERSPTVPPSSTRGSKIPFSDSDSERECTKPCCAGEHHNEKEHVCQSDTARSERDRRTKDNDMPQRRPAKQRKSKGAIQTV